MNYVTNTATGLISLQATLSAGSASNLFADRPIPHHPISCIPGELRFEEDGAFTCEHVTVPPGDLRTQQCIDATVAILLIELASRL